MPSKTPSPGEVGWSAHRGYGWPDQFARIIRWRDRLGKAEEKDILDFVFAFFQACYHLRDWLEFTGSVEKTTLDKLFQDRFEMRACRDICNATKHFSLDSKPSLGREFSMAWEYIGDDRNELVILADGKKLRVLNLANDCVRTWEAFLRDQTIKTVLPDKIHRLFSDLDEGFPERK